MAFHAEAMSEQKRNPISTLDDAVMWLAEMGGEIDFDPLGYKRVIVSVFDPKCDLNKEEPRWLYAEFRADNGFDWREMVMMATRELWEKVNA